MEEKLNKNMAFKRRLLHSRRLRIVVIGIPLAIFFIALNKFFTAKEALGIQLGVYSIVIIFLVKNYRRSDAANTL